MTRSRASAKSAGTRFETSIVGRLATAEMPSDLVKLSETARCVNTARPLTRRIRFDRMEGSVEPSLNMPRTCEFCGSLFADTKGRGGRQPARRYCSVACKSKARPAIRQALAKAYPCPRCGESRTLSRRPVEGSICRRCAALVGSAASATRPRASQVERFNRKWLRASNGCWIWQATRNGNGYGYFYFDGKQIEAHRASYMLHVGDIPEGLQIDHLCRNRSCVNPEHLEPVTARENALRGTSTSSINAAKTHCVNGHEFTPENTYVTRGPRGLPKRYCRVCRRRRVREYQLRKRVAR